MKVYVVLVEREGFDTEVVGYWGDLESAVEYAQRQRNIGFTATVLDMKIVNR